MSAQGLRTAHLDLDPSQVDVLRKFGMKVFYGDALRLDLLEAAGGKEAKLLVIELMKLGVEHFYRAVFGSSMDLARQSRLEIAKVFSADRSDSE